MMKERGKIKLKLSKEELKKKIDEVIENDDLKISLLEDIEDSVDVTEDETEKVNKSEYEDLKMKYEDIKAKYKERFLKGNDEVEEKEDEVEEKEEIEPRKYDDLFDEKGEIK